MAGAGCQCVSACCSPANQTVDELDSWTQYGAGTYERPPLFSMCTNKFKISVQIYEGGGWINCSASTKIKLTAGTQAVRVAGQTYPGCDASSGSRATWTLQASTGSGGATYSLRVKVDDLVGLLDYYSYFSITVNSAGAGQVINIITS